MLHYYSTDWQAILRSSKVLYRHWLATENPFPTATEGEFEGGEAIQEAIAEFTSQGGVISNGMSNSIIVLIYAIYVDGEITNQMRTMVCIF